MSALLGGTVVMAGAGSPVEPVLSRRGVQFGAYVPPAPWAGMEPVTTLEAALGRRLDIVHFFQAWGSDWGAFNADWLHAATGHGRTALVTWEPWAPGPPDGSNADQPDYRLGRIAAGAFEPYVRQWARGLRDFGAPVYLRPMHEMNGTWYPWAGAVNGNTAQDYIAAWRYLHGVFVEEGALNVRWVWSPLSDDVPAGNRFEQYWPGGDYVDVVALDGYNWGAEVPEYGGWRTFDELFAGAYDRVTALGNQPVWIAEVGSDDVGGSKAAWVADMLASDRYPRLEAIVWFHEDKERDWRMTSSQDVVEAFRQALVGGEQPPPGTVAEDVVGEAVRISRWLFDRAGGDRRQAAFAVVTRADVFADALAGSGLAAQDGPILFTHGLVENGGRLAARTRAEIDRILPAGGTVYLLGGPGAVPEPVADDLVAAGYRVRRLAGPTRVETAVAVAEEIGRLRGQPRQVLLARADDWPDAVTGGAYAAVTGSPLVLTSSRTLHPEVASFLATARPAQIWALGGAAVLSDGVVSAAGAQRVAGPDRAATAVAVARTLWSRVPDTAGNRFVAVPGYRRDGWAYALAHAPLSAVERAPQLLVGDRVPAGVEDFLASGGNTGARSRAVFAAAVVPAPVVERLRALLDAAPAA
jgi:hypothetical protein